MSENSSSTYAQDPQAEVDPLAQLQEATDALREAERHLGDAEHLHRRAHARWLEASKAVAEWVEHNAPRRAPTLDSTEQKSTGLSRGL